MLPKAFKISKNECIPPVNHLCTACISRPQNNVNYLLFMNFLTILLSFQYIKKSPRNSTFPGLLNILYYLRNSRLANTLSKHSLSTGFQCLCGFYPLLYIIGILPSKIISILSGLSPIYALFKYADEQKPVRLPYAT